MKAVEASFNQEKALVEAFSMIMNLRMDLFEALLRNLLVYLYPRHRRLASDKWAWLSGLLVLVILWQATRHPRPERGHVAHVEDSAGRVHSYHSLTSPLVFIGGHPRSGTTLMRAILDSHAQVKDINEFSR